MDDPDKRLYYAEILLAPTSMEEIMAHCYCPCFTSIDGKWVLGKWPRELGHRLFPIAKLMTNGEAAVLLASSRYSEG